MDIIASNPDKFADILNILEDVPREDYMRTGPKMIPRYKLLPRGNELSPASEEEVREMLREKPMVDDMLYRGEGDMTPRKMPLLRGDDEDVMERLMELQRRPEYQYDEENMYEGPRDMRMGGGIMNVPIVNNRIHAFGGFGGIVKSIGKAVGSAAKGIGSAVKSASKLIDPIAQVASFIPGPHQPFAAAYTGARGAGIGGDYGGLQIGGFTPSGGMFGGKGGIGSLFQSGGGGFMPQAPIPSGGIGDFSLGDFSRIASQVGQFQDVRQGGGDPNKPAPSTTANILGTLIRGGISAYGAKKSYDDQKRINEARQREYDNYMRAVERKRRQYETGEGLPELPVTGRTRTKADVIGRPGVKEGGVMDLDVRTNPEGVKEIDYRKKGGFVPPIGIKEKADDIPAMLSNNEFVFTADAVRGAGKGNVNEGAKKMYALMRKLEAGGKV